MAGELLSFIRAPPHSKRHWRSVRAVPRLTANGVVCGAVYRVASLSELSRTATA